MPGRKDVEFSIPDGAALQGEDDGSFSTEAVSEIQSTLERHRDALMRKAGVVMVGESQDAVGRPAIIVGVKDAGALKSIPKELDGVPVVTTVIGEVDALGGGKRGR